MITIVNGNEIMVGEALTRCKDGDTEMILIKVRNKIDSAMQGNEPVLAVSTLKKSETKKKSSNCGGNRRGKEIICTNNGMHFKGAAEAARTLFPESREQWKAIQIRECCKGEKNDVDGLEFKYVCEPNEEQIIEWEFEEEPQDMNETTHVF